MIQSQYSWPLSLDKLQSGRKENIRKKNTMEIRNSLGERATNSLGDRATQVLEIAASSYTIYRVYIQYFLYFMGITK